MKDKRVEITVGITVNVGNYEFVRVDVGLSASADKDGFDDTVEALSIKAHKLLNREAKIAISKHHEGK